MVVFRTILEIVLGVLVGIAGVAVILFIVSMVFFGVNPPIQVTVTVPPLPVQVSG